MDSASRVKVEYTDPTEVFSTFSSQLLPRLPLKELHWSSSSRPIRSIGSLNIELVADERSSPSLKHSPTGQPAGNQDNAIPSKNEGQKKGRRHQIPGLRRTPYLKLYLISCNDVETYKSSYRKELRDWVKNNTPPSQSSTSVNKQDNHDAFEWLIIHVVTQSTDGSSTTSRPHSDKGDTTAEKRPSSGRWPSRNYTSVIEKLRSDFNSTSKNAIDRVAQVQLSEPSMDGPPQVDRRTQDSKNGWGDLIFKAKSLILASFDLRVSQYEEDIREREGQKKVFGWNFNTFFVLKEGLAMGFENMGLLEDALTVYQELDLGLKSAIEEQQGEGPEHQTAHFMEYTEDLYEDFKQAKMLTKRNVTADPTIRSRIVAPGSSILNTNRKPFRDLILSNKISIFDFQCYVFARQVNLSLRLARVDVEEVRFDKATAFRGGASDGVESSSDATVLSKPSDYEPEDLLLLARVAESSIEFLTSTTRTFRADIQCAVAQSQASQHEIEKSISAVTNEEVENFVTSWLFSASQCVLEVTSTRSLTAQISPLLRQLLLKAASTETTSGDGHSTNVEDGVLRKDLPTRTSSISPTKPARPLSPPHEQFSSLSSLDAVRLLPPGNPHPGSQDLAAERGDLSALRRRVLNNLAVRHEVLEANAASGISTSGSQDGMQDVELDENPQHQRDFSANSQNGASAHSIAGLWNTDLVLAAMSRHDFYRVYETLTIFALAHYVIGGRSKAAEAMTADLAMARFRLKDYSIAALYFRQLAPFYANSKWSDLEISMLDTYAECLKQLKKEEEYVRIGLKIMAKTIEDCNPFGRQQANQPNKFQDPEEGRTNIGKYLNTVLATSKVLRTEMVALLQDYFDDVRLGEQIQHFPDQDGFEVALYLRSLLPEGLPVQSVEVRILSAEAGHNSEIWLSGKEIEIIRPGKAQISLESKVMQPGWYILDKVYIKSSNVNFALDLSPTAQSSLLGKDRDSVSPIIAGRTNDRNGLLVWPRSENLDLGVGHYESINLEQPSSIKVEIATGHNNVIGCQLFLRAASAGLRLHTAEAQTLNGNAKVTDKGQPGSISIGALSADTKINTIIPYSLETNLREISVRAMIEYITTKGEFVFACNTNVSIVLPLAINVQDHFQHAALVSRFSIGTSSALPVRISNCRLECKDGYRVVSPPLTSSEFNVLVRQPLSMVAKIYQSSGDQTHSKPNHKKIFLEIDYRCLDQIVYAAAEKTLLSALDGTPHLKFLRVLKPALLAKLRMRAETQDLEAVCLVGQVDMGTFEEWNWALLLRGIPSEESEGLEKWLRNWHERNRVIVLDDRNYLSPMQHLTVPVEIPQMRIVNTARLRRLTTVSGPPQLDSVPIGRGIPMELIIHHTRKWDKNESQGTEAQALDFCFEIRANADLWIIGGQWRAHYSSMENEVKTFGLLLWPQKTGHLPLPSLEVCLLNRSDDQRNGVERSAEPGVSCELDYQNVGETILVVPDLKSTTVSLDPDSGGGGCGGRLVESISNLP